MDITVRGSGITAIVEHDYTAKEPDELNLVKGEILHNVKIQAGGWWDGTLASGKTGVFPDNFVRLLDPDDKNPVVLRDKSTTLNRKCKVVYSYTQNNNDELSLVIGDIIEFLGEVEEGWWRGKLGNKIGVFPSNFVIAIDSVSPVLAKRNSKSSSAGGRIRNSLSSSREDLVLEKDAPSLPPKPVREICQVLFPYAPANDDELELNEGDIITVLAKELADKGWWKGELKGKVGVFPDNFVKLISPEASPSRDLHRPDRPSVTPKELNVSSNSNKSSTRKDSFGSRDSLHETTGIVTGNVAAYRKSLENRVAAVDTQQHQEKSTRKSFETKMSSDFRKSLENLDEKKTTPPPVLTKKPVVPIKKSPTVSSVAGNLLSGLKQIVKSDKFSSNDSLDGIGSSKVVTYISDNSDKGAVCERMKKDDCEFDHVERGSMLPDMRAGRVKAPKRRLPSSSVSFSSTELSSTTSTYQNGSNVMSESLFDVKFDSVDDENKSKIRNWEKHKAPWMDELKANQAKKTSPNITESKSPEGKIPAAVAAAAPTAETHHEINDVTKQTVGSSSISSQKKSVNNTSVELRTSITNSDMKIEHHKTDTENTMSKSMSMTTTRTTSSDQTSDCTKTRPSSVNLRNRIITTKSHDLTNIIGTSGTISNSVITSNLSTTSISNNTISSPNTISSGVNVKLSASPNMEIQTEITYENVCMHVVALEKKVSKLELIVEQQNQTIEELIKSLKDESDRVKILKSELDKYAQCVTQV